MRSGGNVPPHLVLYSHFSPGTPLLGQNNGVSPVSNHLWEPAASSRLVGVPPTRREIPPRLDPSVRRYGTSLFVCTSDFHTLFPEGAVLRSLGMAFVHYLCTDQQRSSSVTTTRSMVGVPTHSGLRRCWASSERSDLIMLCGMRIRTRVGSFLSQGTW